MYVFIFGTFFMPYCLFLFLFVYCFGAFNNEVYFLVHKTYDWSALKLSLQWKNLLYENVVRTWILRFKCSVTMSVNILMFDSKLSNCASEFRSGSLLILPGSGFDLRKKSDATCEKTRVWIRSSRKIVSEFGPVLIWSQKNQKRIQLWPFF